MGRPRDPEVSDDGPPAFAPGNELEAAMAAAARDPELTPRFIQALRDAQLFLPRPGDAPAPEQEVRLEEGEELELPVFEYEGRQYVPVFTSQGQLLRARPEGSSYLRIEGGTLATVLPSDLGLAVNPGGELGIPLPAEEVQKLREAPAPGPPVIPAGTDVMVGAPAEERPQVLEAVSAFAREHPQVTAAHRALVLVKAAGERPRLVIGLELAPGANVEALLRDAVVAAAAAGGQPPELVVVEGEHLTDITAWMVEQDQPFYRS